MIDDGKSDVSALTTKTNKTASGALKRHCKLCGKLVANWWKHKKDVHNGLEVPFLSCAINCSICQGKSTPWVAKPTPGWANLLPGGQTYSLGGQTYSLGGQTYSRVGKPTPWVGKAHHLVLTIFLIITLFLGLNEPSIIEKAKKSRRGVHKMGECVMCGKENETRRLVNG